MDHIHTVEKKLEIGFWNHNSNLVISIFNSFENSGIEIELFKQIFCN